MRRPLEDPIRVRRGDGRESGFTLVEALVAIVVLIFGLMAVTNLMLVAASSNSVGNQSTAAVTTASRVMDMLKTTSFESLLPMGIDWEAPPGGGPACGLLGLSVSDRHCTDSIPGVGTVHAHWWVRATTDPRLVHILVRAEGLGALSGARSRAEFTTFRACTNVDAGCPDPSTTGP
jgi:hypothetical protein